MLIKSYTVTIEFTMKYQQLNNLESGWKYAYLMKKHREGEMITCHIENSAAQEAIRQLLELEKEPEKVIAWINQHRANNI